MGRYLFLLILIILASCGEQDILEGRAKAVDGDSLVLNNVINIRLWGIDAPEYRQNCQKDGRNITCGLMAKAHLQSLIKGQKITCEQKDIDQYERIVAICKNSQDVELNKEMVQSGWAIDYTRYSYGKYRIIEYKAKQQNLGIWQYVFEFPSIWRKVNKGKLRK